MKKSFWMLGVAAVALASCSNEDVLEVNGDNAIRFETFVNNNTRAVDEINRGALSSKYYMFGYAGEAPVYNNEDPTATIAYWAPNTDYVFAGYANGKNNAYMTNGVSFDKGTSKLSFTDYMPNDANDLIATMAYTTTDADVTNENAVGISFKHMLSQLKFTFKTTDADGIMLKISDMSVKAIQKADGSYTNVKDQTAVIAWENGTLTDKAYAFDEIADVADKASNYTASTNSKLVIPQSLPTEDASAVKVTFTATASGAGLTETSKTFTSILKFDGGQDAQGGIIESGKWIPGYRYNYVATITAKMIIDQLDSIEFTPTVEDWKDAKDEDYTPSAI